MICTPAVSAGPPRRVPSASGRFPFGTEILEPANDGEGSNERELPACHPEIPHRAAVAAYPDNEHLPGLSSPPPTRRDLRLEGRKVTTKGVCPWGRTQGQNPALEGRKTPAHVAMSLATAGEGSVPENTCSSQILPLRGVYPEPVEGLSVRMTTLIHLTYLRADQ